MVISPQVARTPRETDEPKPFSFEMLRDFGNRVAEAYGLAFTLPEDLQAIGFNVMNPRRRTRVLETSLRTSTTTVQELDSDAA